MRTYPCTATHGSGEYSCTLVSNHTGDHWDGYNAKAFPAFIGTDSPAKTAKPLTEIAADAGIKMARHAFSKRGNHSEAHLSEAELAGLMGVAFQMGWEQKR